MADSLPNPSDHHTLNPGGDRAPNTSESNGQNDHPLNLLSITAEGNNGPKLQVGKTTDESVQVNGAKRDFALHVPQNWDGKSSLPVLYYFNGMHPGGLEPESFTGLSERADRMGFAVAYMRGSNDFSQTYNNGQRVFANNMDESAYLNAVRQRVGTELPLDTAHQGLAGFSEGGSEAYALAAKNNWVSSVQTVEGYMTGAEKPLDHPVSEQNIHALHDPVIPHNGTNQVCDQANTEMQAIFTSMQYGTDGYFDPKQLLHAITCSVERDGNNIEPQSTIVSTYRAAAGANTEGQTTTTPDQTTRSYINPVTGAEVRQVVLQQGTHGWAGSTDHSGDIAIIGKPNETFIASDAIADFFLHHPLVHNAAVSEH